VAQYKTGYDIILLSEVPRERDLLVATYSMCVSEAKQQDRPGLAQLKPAKTIGATRYTSQMVRTSNISSSDDVHYTRGGCFTKICKGTLVTYDYAAI
jgi:hypothetical protein